MPEKLTEPRQFLLHELGDALTFERTIMKLLPKFEQEATDKELAKGFKKHQQQTKKHVENVEKAFRAMGERPKAEPCPGIDGLKKEHDEFVRTKPTPQVLDWFLTGAATRTEHYEWAAYEGLITIARGLGETKVAGFLEQNLKQDKETLKEIQSVAKRFAREAGKKQETTTVETPAAARPTRKRTTGKRTGGTQSSRAKGTGTRTTGGRTGTRATGTRKGTSTGRRGTGRTTTRTGTASTTGQRTRP